jgi:hypothetical protein
MFIVMHVNEVETKEPLFMQPSILCITKCNCILDRLIASEAS